MMSSDQKSKTHRYRHRRFLPTRRPGVAPRVDLLSKHTETREGMYRKSFIRIAQTGFSVVFFIFFVLLVWVGLAFVVAPLICFSKRLIKICRLRCRWLWWSRCALWWTQSYVPVMRLSWQPLVHYVLARTRYILHKKFLMLFCCAARSRRRSVSNPDTWLRELCFISASGPRRWSYCQRFCRVNMDLMLVWRAATGNTVAIGAYVLRLMGMHCENQWCCRVFSYMVILGMERRICCWLLFLSTVGPVFGVEDEKQDCWGTLPW